jgi:hypothetical protein
MNALFRYGARIAQAEAVASINVPVPEFGGDYFGDTTLHSPNVTTNPGPTPGWMGVLVLTTAVFDAATQVNITGLATVSIPAGTFVPAIFSQIKLSSGSIIAYRATD